MFLQGLLWKVCYWRFAVEGVFCWLQNYSFWFGKILRKQTRKITVHPAANCRVFFLHERKILKGATPSDKSTKTLSEIFSRCRSSLSLHGTPTMQERRGSVGWVALIGNLQVCLMTSLSLIAPGRTWSSSGGSLVQASFVVSMKGWDHTYYRLFYEGFDLWIGINSFSVVLRHPMLLVQSKCCKTAKSLYLGGE